MNDYELTLARRIHLGSRRPSNWLQLVKFAAVGASGYVVNLAVFAVLAQALGLHHLLAAVGAFCVAVSSNYFWNRHWTFRERRGHVYHQGLRFLIVSLGGLALNLSFLRGLVALDVGKIFAQAIAAACVMPFTFTANKLWSFRA